MDVNRTGTDGDDEAALPAGIKAAWGLRERPGKGPKPGLSLSRIVEAAIGVADSDGLAAASMSRVAGELGTSAMSLYRYVASKDELLVLMRDAAYGPPPAMAPNGGWRAGLTHCATAMLAAWRRHSWTLEIPISGPPSTPNEVAWMEEMLVALREVDLTEGERVSTLLLLANYVRGQAHVDAQIEAALEASGETPNEWMSSYAELLRRVLDPRRFPELTAVLATGELDKADEPRDDFLFGLNRILDGIEVLLRARS